MGAGEGAGDPSRLPDPIEIQSAPTEMASVSAGYSVVKDPGPQAPDHLPVSRFLLIRLFQQAPMGCDHYERRRPGRLESVGTAWERVLSRGRVVFERRPSVAADDCAVSGGGLATGRSESHNGDRLTRQASNVSYRLQTGGEVCRVSERDRDFSVCQADVFLLPDKPNDASSAEFKGWDEFPRQSQAFGKDKCLGIIFWFCCPAA